jgi:phosphoglycolate phosphatase
VIQSNWNFDPDKMRLLIFDLDGTLIDSRQDLINSMNGTLHHFGRLELPAEDRQFTE